MAIFLPERTASAARSLTPREIVAELDKFVIGQAKAKRADFGVAMTRYYNDGDVVVAKFL